MIRFDQLLRFKTEPKAGLWRAIYDQRGDLIQISLARPKLVSPPTLAVNVSEITLAPDSDS